MYELVIRTIDGKELRRFDLARVESAHRRVIIGRAEDCDIRIASPSVSRHHCAIEPDEDDEWIIRDLGSTHGVVQGGVKVSQAEIRDGLTVQIGPAVLQFQSSSARIAAELAREMGEEKAG
jgi:pSer/pThr/pTyr-binding forkhead associated (FHA) protein